MHELRVLDQAIKAKQINYIVPFICMQSVISICMITEVWMKGSVHTFWQLIFFCFITKEKILC